MSDHSGSRPSYSCLLNQCNITSNDENSCFSASAPCFVYQASNGTTICAPGILCSALEPCDNSTLTCTSSSSICVVNSCCSPTAVCLPVSALSFCLSPTFTYSGSNISFMMDQDEKTVDLVFVSSMGFIWFYKSSPIDAQQHTFNKWKCSSCRRLC